MREIPRSHELPILVVDDDPLVLRTLSEVLAVKGYTVHTARHGGEALDLLDRTRVGVILLDREMLVMDGSNFVVHLRSRGHLCPIIAMSGQAGLPEWTIEIGAVGFLTKPFRLADVWSLVASVFEPESEARSPPYRQRG